MYAQTLGYDRYHVLGWSDGGNSAVILAALRPENVTKLVIWGANAYVSDKDQELYEGMREWKLQHVSDNVLLSAL